MKMTDIELPTYRIIMANEVFGKRAEPLQNSLIGKIDATQIVRLTRFKVPTQDEVVNFIIRKAQEVDIYSIGKEKPSDNEPKIIRSLRLLPEKEVLSVIERNKDSLQHLKNHYPESSFQEGKDYIDSTIGIIPDFFLDLTTKFSEKQRGIAYENLMSKMGLRKWGLRIRLLEDFRFPDSLELEYLMDKGVKDSDVLSVHGDFREYSVVANQIRLFYNSLKSPEMIRKIRDSSYQFLEEIADSTVSWFAKCLSLSKSLGEIFDTIKQVNGEMDKYSDEEFREKVRGNCGFSYN